MTIGELKECKTKYLPMDYDERYHKDGRCWYSSCSTKEEKTNSSGKTRTIIKKIGKIKVTEVLGEESSTCKVTESSVPLEEGMFVSYEKK